jgi:hypothetical protein
MDKGERLSKTQCMCNTSLQLLTTKFSVERDSTLAAGWLLFALGLGHARCCVMQVIKWAIYATVNWQPLIAKFDVLCRSAIFQHLKLCNCDSDLNFAHGNACTIKMEPPPFQLLQ